MKKLTFIILILAFICTRAFSQGCLPEGITFTTQAQIDSFQVNYPGCTVIEGDVVISGENLTNMNGLNMLNTIGGSFLLKNTSLTSLNGLENLKYIGGNLSLGHSESWMNCEGNYYLISLDGLNSLDSIGGDLEIECSHVLTSLNGLESLIFIGGNLIIGNDKIGYGVNASLTSLSGLNNLTLIEGGIAISRNGNLHSLTGLEGLTSVKGGITINRNPGLINLTGLNNLSFIGGGLFLYDNDSLVNLSGLDNLDSIGGALSIGWCYGSTTPEFPGGNNALISLDGLGNLTKIGEGINIGQNNSLKSLSGLQNIDPGTIASLEICRNHSLSDCDVQSICDYLLNPHGYMAIKNNAPGCNSPAEVQAACLMGVDSFSENNFTIYPNPSPGHFTFEFSLQQQSSVNLVVLNSLGQVVATLADEVLTPGPHQVYWNAVNLPAGMYFIQLKTENQFIAKKIIKQ